jgi:hypothetical protein
LKFEMTSQTAPLHLEAPPRGVAEASMDKIHKQTIQTDTHTDTTSYHAISFLERDPQTQRDKSLHMQFKQRLDCVAHP